MKLEQRIRQSEARLFARGGIEPDESFVDLGSSHVRLRVLSVGAGPSLVMLHGVSLTAAAWVPWLADLSGYRAHLVELPGHGLSGPFTYRTGAVRGNPPISSTTSSTHSPSPPHQWWAIHSGVCSRFGTRPLGQVGSSRSSPSAHRPWL